MALDCPRCLTANLEEIEIANVIIDRCRRCAGLWFDRAEIEMLVGKEPRFKQVEAVTPPVETVESSLKCPRCSDVHLRKLEFEVKPIRKQLLFHCVSCLGTWLDRGELRDEEDCHLAEMLTAYFGRTGHEVRD